jgi:hypothetical protein
MPTLFKLALVLFCGVLAALASPTGTVESARFAHLAQRDVRSDGPLTNAARLARGLPPRAPVHLYSPTRASLLLLCCERLNLK